MMNAINRTSTSVQFDSGNTNASHNPMGYRADQASTRMYSGEHFQHAGGGMPPGFSTGARHADHDVAAAQAGGANPAQGAPGIAGLANVLASTLTQALPMLANAAAAMLGMPAAQAGGTAA